MIPIFEQGVRNSSLSTFACSALELMEVFGFENDLGSTRAFLIGMGEIGIGLYAGPESIGESMSSLSS